MPIVRRIIPQGNSKAVTIPSSWLKYYEDEYGEEITEVLMEVNRKIIIVPHLKMDILDFVDYLRSANKVQEIKHDGYIPIKTLALLQNRPEEEIRRYINILLKRGKVEYNPDKTMIKLVEG